MAQGGTWGHNLALPPSTAQMVLPQPLALQGAGLGIRDAQGIELGNAWYFYTSCPPSGQCVVPKSPAEQGSWKIPPLPQGWQQGWLSVGTAAAHNHRGVLGRSPGVAWQWDTLAVGHPGTAGTGALELVDALPSQAGSAVPLSAFAHTGIFLRSSN